MNIEALKEAHDLSLDGRDFAARQIILDVIADLEKKEPAQQEPVALGYMNAGHVHEMQQGRLPYGYVYPKEGVGAHVALYTSPPAQRTWVGLTDEDKAEIKKQANYNWETTAGEYASKVQALTEAKLKEKNT